MRNLEIKAANHNQSRSARSNKQAEIQKENENGFSLKATRFLCFIHTLYDKLNGETEQ